MMTKGIGTIYSHALSTSYYNSLVQATLYYPLLSVVPLVVVAILELYFEYIYTTSTLVYWGFSGILVL